MIYFAIFARLLFLAYLIIVAWQVVVLYKEIVDPIGFFSANQKPPWCEITKISIPTDKIWHGFYYLGYWDFYLNFFIRYLYDEVCWKSASHFCRKLTHFSGIKWWWCAFRHCLKAVGYSLLTDLVTNISHLNVCFVHRHSKFVINIYILWAT